jgi:hypothetical protein
MLFSHDVHQAEAVLALDHRPQLVEAHGGDARPAGCRIVEDHVRGRGKVAGPAQDATAHGVQGVDHRCRPPARRGNGLRSAGEGPRQARLLSLSHHEVEQHILLSSTSSRATTACGRPFEQHPARLPLPAAPGRAPPRRRAMMVMPGGSSAS